jgi:dihydroneopterin aldolase
MAGRGARRDRIEVRGLRVMGIHGVLAHERERAQPFEVDLDLVVDMTKAARSDDLADTVDYSAVVARAESIVAGPHSFQLLEALADAIATESLALDRRLRAVRVWVRKLDPPVPERVGSVGVSITRRRKDGA